MITALLFSKAREVVFTLGKFLRFKVRPFPEPNRTLPTLAAKYTGWEFTICTRYKTFHYLFTPFKIYTGLWYYGHFREGLISLPILSQFGRSFAFHTVAPPRYHPRLSYGPYTEVGFYTGAFNAHTRLQSVSRLILGPNDPWVNPDPADGWLRATQSIRLIRDQPLPKALMLMLFSSQSTPERPQLWGDWLWICLPTLAQWDDNSWQSRNVEFLKKISSEFEPQILDESEWDGEVFRAITNFAAMREGQVTILIEETEVEVRIVKPGHSRDCGEREKSMSRLPGRIFTRVINQLKTKSSDEGLRGPGSCCITFDASPVLAATSCESNGPYFKVNGQELTEIHKIW
ncbi:hypothetical protein B0H10DRAFT_2199579 [Mycena sp. CBHHK59/15]|nr:hypothetical protein B0H10DRAFT_2199579 [Mycena sp. CBHHK59/15]